MKTFDIKNVDCFHCDPQPYKALRLGGQLKEVIGE